jgi:GNAT superfamily N-acetyltransferase
MSVAPRPIASELAKGITIEDRTGSTVLYRLLTQHDDLSAMTSMLHEAYAPLAAAGMRFVASWQSVAITRQRTEKGMPLVAVLNRDVVATATVATIANTGGSSFYDRPDVASVGQFAVLPVLQQRGIGSTLMQLAEQCAAEMGASYLALDTSEHAAHLIAFYERRGYSFVEHVRWPDVNYRSVVMAKPIEGTELPVRPDER